MIRLVTTLLLVQLPAIRVAAQDTVVVRADNPPVWGGAVRIVRELRIGQVEGAPEYTFGRISGVTAGADGSIYVLDSDDAIVRQYNAAGKYVRSFGRRGEGPGELHSPEAVTVLGNRLIVRDMGGNRRFVFYPLNGGEPQHWRYPSSFASPQPNVAHADGSISVPFAFSRGNANYQPAVLRYQPDGTIRDTLLAPAFAPPAPMVVSDVTGGGIVRYTIPYTSGPVWTYTPRNQFIGGNPSRYSLVVTDGRMVRRIDRSGQRVPVEDAERSALKNRLERQIQRLNNPNYKWNGPDIPSLKPFYKSLRVDSDERIWVQLHSPSIPVPLENGEVSYREAVNYDVISSSGRYLGQIRFPDRFTLHHARGNLVWGVEQDEFDVNYVVRYRLQIPAGR